MQCLHRRCFVTSWQSSLLTRQIIQKPSGRYSGSQVSQMVHVSHHSFGQFTRGCDFKFQSRFISVRCTTMYGKF